jgi:hypothetical protein
VGLSSFLDILNPLFGIFVYTKEHNIKMENKLNFSAIESYAKAYSGKICDDLYRDKSVISGNDLLNLPVDQVGLFTLNEIHSRWQSEAENLKSSFFNYEAEEVKSAMKKLMNVLSKNISVDRENLEPLLRESVKDVLLLTLSPYSYFKNLLNRLSSAGEFAEIGRFIRINSGLAKEIERSLESNGHVSLLERYDQIFNEIDITPDDAKPVLARLSETHPASETSFYLTMEMDDEEEELELGSTEATLNDRFINSNYETVADTLKHHQSNKGSIKSMLSINQKFMFINDLFNDNQDDFNKVVDFIEGCDTKEAAMSFISNNYLKHNIWNPNAPQVREFIRLVELQFE